MNYLNVWRFFEKNKKYALPNAIFEIKHLDPHKPIWDFGTFIR